MTDKKKPWTEPELIVLVRSNPEEAALTGCKMWPNPTMGPGTTVTRCGVVTTCLGCEAFVAS